MARRRSTARIIPFTARSAAPTIIAVPSGGGMRRRSRRSGGAVRRRKGTRRRKGPVAGGGGLFNQERIGAMAGGFLLGVLDKQGTSLPTIPVLGRAGTLAVALYFGGKQFKMPLAVHMSTAALAIATYELGNKGSISGVDTV